MNNHVAYNCGGASGTTTVAAGGCSELSGNPSDKVGGGVNAALPLQRSDRRQRRTVHRRYVVEGRDGTDVFANIGQGSTFGIYGGSNSAGDLRQHHRQPAV